MALAATSPVFGATNADEKLFLEPHLSSFVGKVADKIGDGVADSLGSHLRAIAASLKPNGEAIITASASYDIVFTQGNKSEKEVEQEILKALAKIASSEDPKVIETALNELTSVARATFISHNGKMELVRDARTLTPGQTVWRKNPEGIRLEKYHSEEEYLVAIRDAGLTCVEIKRPCFFGEVKWKAYNALTQTALGPSYMHNHPFTLYQVVKKGA